MTTDTPQTPSVTEPTTTSSTTTMTTPSPQRTATLLSNLSAVTSRITTASSRAPAQKPIRLVAVSKLKPASDILALHNPPTNQLHFGENYVQELLEKSRILPAGIRWHFIGGLQSNKCVSLARDVRGLWAVESVDTEKKASLLDKGWGQRSPSSSTAPADTTSENQNNNNDNDTSHLRVFVQINTSGEPNKSGAEPHSAPALCRFIRDKCPNLKLQGLMTIGAIARSQATGPGQENEDFLCLRDTRDRVGKELGLGDVDAVEKQLELSMGMSEDFEGAIVLGSDQVRVGSTIFGERPLKAEARVV